MGGSTYPFFRFLRKLSQWNESRKNAPVLRANREYLTQCKKEGRSPYDGLEEHLKSLKKRGKE